MTLRLPAAALAAALLAPSAPAAELSDADALAALAALRRPVGATLEAVLVETGQKFRRADVDDSGAVTAEDAALAVRIERTEAVAKALLDALRLDLDGDLALTEAEVAGDMLRRERARAEAELAAEARAELAAKAREALAEVDPDGDGRATLVELAAHVRASPKLVKPGDPLREVLGVAPARLEADGDGVLTLAEHEAAVRRGFALADLDGDGALGEAETRAVRAEELLRARDHAERPEGPRDIAAELRRRAACEIEVAKDPLLVLVATERGAAEAPGGATLATVEIKESRRGIVLLLRSAAPLVLRVTGAAERLERVVPLGAPVTLEGAPGTAIDPRSEACALRSWDFASPAGWDDFALVTAAAGRLPDRGAAHAVLGRLSLPSGQHEEGPAAASRP